MKKVKLSDLCIESEIGKYGIPASAEAYDKNKVRYLRISDIDDLGNLINTDRKSISSDEIEKYILKEGEIVFARTGNSTGRTYFHEDKNGILAFAGFLIKFGLDKRKVNPKYLKYYTISDEYKSWVNNLSVGSTRGNINAQTFAGCPILLPERKQQDFLVKILSVIDDKIEVLHQINDNLSELAKTIYDYWFVQFDFPDENGKPYKTSGGKMVYNDILKREIPEGWEVKKLGEVIEPLESGKRPKGGIDKTLKEGIPSLGAECIDELGIFNFSSTRYIPYSFQNKITSGVIKNNDILIYKDGAYVGKTTIFKDNFPFDYATINEHIFLMRAKNVLFQNFLLFTLKQKNYFDIMQSLGQKAAQPGLNQEDLKSIKILVPNQKNITDFYTYSEKLLISIFKNANQSKELQSLRDWLLPMLMNGQISVE